MRGSARAPVVERGVTDYSCARAEILLVRFQIASDSWGEPMSATPASNPAQTSLTPNRRRFVLTATAAAAAAYTTTTQRPARAAIVQTDAAKLPPLPLPAGIRSRYVSNINGLTFHVLEAGFESRGRPCVLLLHGYPE